MNNMIILKASNIYKEYDNDNDNIKTNIQILKNINFSVEQGKSIAIVGASGSGKSTLLHILGGLDLPSSGSIEFMGKPWGGLDKKHSIERNQYMGFIYQFHHLIWELSALENAMLPLWIAQGKTHTSEQIKIATALLEKLGLGDRANNLPSQLSGGERQRVAIARAIINKPKCILADEPTGNLDRTNADMVFDMLKDMCIEYGSSLVVVTHDASLSAKCDSIYNI
jgi:lipoprotein-releasing system ATP-binding protein